MHGKISRGRVGYTLKFFRVRVSGYTWENSRGRVPPEFGAPGVGWLRFSYSYGELCFIDFLNLIDFLKFIFVYFVNFNDFVNFISI